MTQPKISIIVPVYNTEKYLHRCIDSILVQTFTDFELLLINDGSNDCSGEICDEYAAKDSRIKVFHKENGGVSSARNLGLDNAKGEWVTFVDSDDSITTIPIAQNVNSEADIIITSLVDSRTNNGMILDNAFIEKQDLGTFLSTAINNNILRTPYAKFLRRDIIEQYHLRLDLNMKLGEDTLFIRQYLKYITNIQTIKQDFYQISETAGLSHALLTGDEAIYSIDLICNSLKDLEQIHRFDAAEVLINDIRFFFLRATVYIGNSNVSFKEKRKELLKLVENKNIQRLLEDSKYLHKRIRRKTFDWLAKHKLYTILTLYLCYSYRYE